MCPMSGKEREELVIKLAKTICNDQVDPCDSCRKEASAMVGVIEKLGYTINHEYAPSPRTH